LDECIFHFYYLFLGVKTFPPYSVWELILFSNQIKLYCISFKLFWLGLVELCITWGWFVQEVRVVGFLALHMVGLLRYRTFYKLFPRRWLVIWISLLFFWHNKQLLSLFVLSLWLQHSCKSSFSILGVHSRTHKTCDPCSRMGIILVIWKKKIYKNVEANDNTKSYQLLC
jgi:hypothetical protein